MKTLFNCLIVDFYNLHTINATRHVHAHVFGAHFVMLDVISLCVITCLSCRCAFVSRDDVVRPCCSVGIQLC